MSTKIFRGGVAGAIAGVIMGLLAWSLFRTGLLSVNPFVVSADLVLKKSAALSPLGTWVGLGLHLFISASFGVFFALLTPSIGPLALWGLFYGIGLELANSGIIGPLLGVTPPLAQTDLATIVSATISRLVYGGILGYLLGLLESRDPKA